MKKCPYCAEEIQDEAIVCRYCGRELVHKPKLEEELADKRAAILNKAVLEYQNDGWILISNSAGVAQLKKPKVFNWAIFILGIILLLIIAIIYLIAYAVEKDEIVTLTTDENCNLVEDGETILPEDLEEGEGEGEEKKTPWLTILFLGLIVVLIGIIAIAILSNIH
jgi:hypothetical protein